MSLFLIEANVTGTDSTVTAGVYPMSRSSCAVSAVVEVTSVQPTSENRTVRQLGGSAGAAVLATWAAALATWAPAIWTPAAPISRAPTPTSRASLTLW